MFVVTVVVSTKTFCIEDRAAPNESACPFVVRTFYVVSLVVTFITNILMVSVVSSEG